VQRNPELKKALFAHLSCIHFCFLIATLSTP
jgi:hypothetical protein